MRLSSSVRSQVSLAHGVGIKARCSTTKRSSDHPSPHCSDSTDSACATVPHASDSRDSSSAADPSVPSGAGGAGRGGRAWTSSIGMKGNAPSLS